MPKQSPPNPNQLPPPPPSAAAQQKSEAVAAAKDTLKKWNAKAINAMAADIHRWNEKWWRDLETGQPIERNRGEQLMLVVSEIAEAMEGERKDLMDDKLPHRPMAEVELADAVIRICDYAAGHGYDLGGAIVEKCRYNRTRHDHSEEGRKAAGGKKW